MDISKAILARSDQLNAVDLPEPVVVTIVDVREGDKDQPVHIVTDAYGPERPFKPSRTVLRDLGKAWGIDTKPWVGRRMGLYNEPSVKWAGKPVGGIRLNALSHIDGPIQTVHTITRGQYKEVTIKPLAAGPDPQVVAAAVADLAGAESLPALKAAWDLASKRGVQSHPDVVAAKDARKGELS